MRSPNTASPRMRCTRTASVRRPSCCRARSRAYAWLRRTIELLAEGSNPEEFLEHTKLELFHDQVFCFTPKGKLIALPREANADRLCLCRAHRRRQHRGRLQDQRQDRAADLRTGQRRRSRNHHLEGATAPPAALGVDRRATGKARAAIRRATRAAVREQYARARPPHRRASVSARQDGLFGRKADRRAAALGALVARRSDGRGRPQRA